MENRNGHTRVRVPVSFPDAGARAGSPAPPGHLARRPHGCKLQTISVASVSVRVSHFSQFGSASHTRARGAGCASRGRPAMSEMMVLSGWLQKKQRHWLKAWQVREPRAPRAPRPARPPTRFGSLVRPEGLPGGAPPPSLRPPFRPGGAAQAPRPPVAPASRPGPRARAPAAPPPRREAQGSSSISGNLPPPPAVAAAARAPPRPARRPRRAWRPPRTRSPAPRSKAR